MTNLAKELQRLVDWLRADGRPEALDSARAMVTMSQRWNWTGKKVKPWTIKEIKFLKDNYKTLPRKKIASHMGRSVHSVGYKMSELGLRTTRSKRHDQQMGLPFP